MFQEIYTKIGHSTSKVAAIAVEGPPWAQTTVLYDHLVDRLHRNLGWCGVRLELSAKEGFEGFKSGLLHAPMSKAVYRNHVLSVFPALFPGNQKVPRKSLVRLEKILYVIVYPDVSASNISCLSNRLGITKECILKNLTVYKESANRSGLNFVAVSSSRTLTSWKAKAFLAIAKKIRDLEQE